MQNPNIFVPGEVLQPNSYDEVHGDTLGLRAVRRVEELWNSELNAAELMRLRERVGQALGEAALTAEQRDLLQDEYDEIDIKIREFEGFAKLDTKAVRAHLSSTRAIIRDFSTAQRQGFDQYMDDLNNSNFVNGVKTIAETDHGTMDWADWLTEGATDEQLVNFLQWHVDILNRQQVNPETQKLITDTKELFKKRVQEGIDEGWLSAAAQLAIAKIDKVNVLIGDIFDTYFMDRAGYYLPINNNNTLVIAQGIGYNHDSQLEHLLGECLNNALIHEFCHALLENDQTESECSLRATWIDEALTEHIRLVIIDGQPGTITERTGTIGNYPDNRALLADFLRLGKRQIAPELAMCAYSGGEAEQVALFAELDAAWGPGAMEAMNKRIRKHTLKIALDIWSKPENNMSKEEVIEIAKIQAIKATHDDLKLRANKIFGGKLAKKHKTKKHKTA